MLAFEQLESRCNPSFVMCVPCDVSHDGRVLQGDMLQEINAINAGSTDLRYDVNLDGVVTPNDALRIGNYINRLPATMVDVTILDADTVGFDTLDVREAIKAAFAEYSEVADIGFWFVNDPSSGVSVTTIEIYVGNGLHYRGMMIYPTVYLHNGIIAPYHHSGANGPIDQWLYYQVYADLGSITRVTMHEFGHWIGWQHTTDTSCIMYTDTGPGFCQSEINSLVALFGAAR